MEGRRCRPFVYSGKVLLSIKDYEKKMELEMERVRKLKHGGKWITYKRGTEKYLYVNDSVSPLSGVGKKATERLHKMGISKISDLITLHDNSPGVLLTCMTENRLQKIMQQLEGVRNEDRLDCIDHRRADNPYASKYGNTWREPSPFQTPCNSLLFPSEVWSVRRSTLMEGTAWNCHQDP